MNDEDYMSGWEKFLAKWNDTTRMNDNPILSWFLLMLTVYYAILLVIGWIYVAVKG